jgi:hypothetical protein
MDQYLLLQKNGRVFMLVRYTDRYHIIAVNDKFDEEKEEKVLAGNCTDAAIDEMGLNRETVMKTELRGVAMGGCCAGDVVVLYTRSRKLKFALSDDYSSEEMKAMFTGIERFQPPKNSGSKSRKADWRTELQVESQQKVMGIIGGVLDVGGCVCFVATVMFGRLSAAWSVICMAFMVISMGLYLAYPQYFSLMGAKEYNRVGYTAKVTHLDFAVVGPALGLAVRCFWDYYIPTLMPVLLAGVLMGAAVSIVLYIRAREVKENLSFTVVVLIMSVLLSFGVAVHVNHLANFDPDDPQICTVVDTRREGGGRHADRYYCSVILESGGQIEIPISDSAYHQLQSGDEVTIFTGRGALGIEYAYYVGMK